MEAETVRKIILVGNGSVGKSSLISRFVDASFNRMYKQTVGLDFFEKTVQIRDQTRVTMQVWDIGGQNAGSKMLPKYVFGSHVIALCYDITDKRSFQDLEDWLTLIRRSSSQLAKIFLVGNKIDQIHLRQVPKLQHSNMIKSEKFAGGYFVSAQDGDGVLRAFIQMACTSANINLSEHELALLSDTVLQVRIPQTEDPEKSLGGDSDDRVRQIQEEDARDAERMRKEIMKMAHRESKRKSCTIQ